MWIVTNDREAINTDQLIGIRQKGNKIIARPAAAESAAFTGTCFSLPIDEYTIADFEDPEAADEEFVTILSALETGERVYHVGGSVK